MSEPAKPEAIQPPSSVMGDIMAQFTEAKRIESSAAPITPPAAAAKPEPAPAPPDNKPADALPDPTFETPPAQDDDAPSDLSDSAKPHWKTLRQKANTLERDLKTAQSELTKIRTTANPEQFAREKEALLREREDLLKRISSLDIQKRPEFEAYFTKREQNFVETAKRIAGEHGSKLAAIINMPESETKTQALEEILGALPVASQARIGGIINSLESLNLEKQTEIANAHETSKTLREQDFARQHDFISKANSKMNEALERWSDPQKGLAVFQAREGDDEWNRQVESTKTMARQVFSGEGTLDDKIRASMWAAAGPQLLGQLKSEKQRVSELETQLGKLKGVQPSVTGKGPATAPNDDMDDGSIPLQVRMTRLAQSNGAFGR